jgi:tetratricopeptide (TPR) repeat protein
MSRRRAQDAPLEAFFGRRLKWLEVSLGVLILCFGVGILAAGAFNVARSAWGSRSAVLEILDGLRRNTPAERPKRERGAARRARSAEFDLHYRKANEHLAAERHSDAFREFTRAIQLAPDDPRPHHGLGKVYRHLVLDDLAEQCYRRAVELDPDYMPVKISLAMILYDLGKNEEATALLEEAEKRNPDNPFLWAELGINALRLGNPQEAIRRLEKYNEVKGKQAWGYANLGRAYAEAGDHASAEKAYREALAIDPYMASCYLWLGQLLIATGRRAEADRLLEKYQRFRTLQTQEYSIKMALLRDPRNVRTLVQLAHTRHLLGKSRDALLTLERAREVAPQDERLRKLYENFKRSVEGQARHVDQKSERAPVFR